MRTQPDGRQPLTGPLEWLAVRAVGLPGTLAMSKSMVYALSRSMGFELALVALGLAIWVPLLWFSIKAKPLGNKPYRWGTYIGITTGLLALIGLLSVIPKKFNNLDIDMFLYLLFIVTAAISSWGILRRRRVGVVMFVVSYTLLFILPTFLEVKYKRPMSSKNNQGPLALYTIVTFVYFKRRWTLMGKPVDSSAEKTI